MGRKDDEIHVTLGEQHARDGMPRYKYQDQRLQKLYNIGYDRYQGVLEEPARYCKGCGRAMMPGPSVYCSRCRI